MWGLEVDARLARALTVGWLEQRRAHGTTTVIVERRRLRPKVLRRVRRQARAAKLGLLVATRISSRAAKCTDASPCVASSVARAVARSKPPKRLVLVRLKGPGRVHTLRKPRNGRLVAIVRLRRPGNLELWKRAIEIARGDETLDLAVTPAPGASGSAALAMYEGALTGAAGGPPPPGPPGPPPPGPPPPPPPPPPGPAQVFIAPGGSDGNACTQGSPCKSFDRAYRVAQPGQVVEAAGGLYPQQFIYADASKNSQSDVFFRPAQGSVVTIDCDTVTAENGREIGGQSCLDIWGSHMTFDGGLNKDLRSQTYNEDGVVYQGRIDTERGATDITFRHMDIGAAAIGSSQTIITHNDIGPSVDPLNSRQASGTGNVWQDNLIHDYPITNGGHFECITWDGGTNITMEYNEFRSCEVFAIFAKPLDDISGLVDHNAFWNPRQLTTNQDVRIVLGSGAQNCNVTVSNNWISDGTYYTCPGVVDFGNTYHDPLQQPPSPIRGP